MPRLRFFIGALLASASLLPASTASAATLSATVPADATEDAPLSISFSGSTETPRTLFASVIPEARSCAGTALLQETSSATTRLSPTGGAPVTGAFSRALDFTPADDGRFRLCGYLSDSIAAAPVAVADLVFEVRPPATTLSATLDATRYEPGQTITGRVSASSASGGRELQFGWAPSGGDCSGTLESSSVLHLTAGTRLDRAISRTADAATPTYRLCSALVERSSGQREASGEATATLVPRLELLERWRPVAITPDEDEQEDRLRLGWKTRVTSADEEQLEIWDEDPAEGKDPVLSERVDSELLELMDSADGEQDVRVRTFLGFRQFWWSVGADAPNGEIVWSTPRTVTVVPSPMKKKRVRVSVKYTAGFSTKRPGRIRLRIQSSPRARVTVKVFHNGRLYKRKKYTEGVGRLRGIEFLQTCAQSGRFTYEVRMRDPYGTKAVKKGSWTVSSGRCASLRAKEQRKAAEEERNRREREERKRGSGGSGGSGGDDSGGSSCVPGYSRCLTPGIGDYDCYGGGGDGPNWVYEPIGVTGDDPFGLDRGGEPGVGCES